MNHREKERSSKLEGCPGIGMEKNLVGGRKGKAGDILLALPDRLPRFSNSYFYFPGDIR